MLLGLMTLSLPLMVAGCGSDGAPFEMATATTMVLGDAGSGNVQFLINPEESSGSGILTAQITEEFANRRNLVVEAFDMPIEFASVGTLRLVLNPNLESTGTVYRLNSNNQVAGTHTMDLNLILETPDQNLVVSNVMLSSDTATLSLTIPLPTLSFQFMGESKELQTLSLTVVIPVQLITGTEDPL